MYGRDLGALSATGLIPVAITTTVNAISAAFAGMTNQGADSATRYSSHGSAGPAIRDYPADDCARGCADRSSSLCLGAGSESADHSNHDYEVSHVNPFSAPSVRSASIGLAHNMCAMT